MRQLKFSMLSALTVILLVTATFTACKKDPFSEKDALAAQTTLLQTKFSFDLAIKQLDLQIQRSGDSAKIVIQNLINSGATALEILKQTNALAQILANQNNLLAQLRYSDSLANNSAVLTDKLQRLRQLWNDSVALAASNAATSASVALALKKNYSLSFVDFNTQQPISGVTVSVLPSGSSTFVTAVTNGQGTATFNGLVVDPGTYFSASAPNYSLALVREANLVSSFVTGGTTMKHNNPATAMYNSGNLRNTLRGSILGDLNLTNGDAVEAIVGQLVTLTATVTVNSIPTVYTFSTLSDATGSYSVTLPDANYTVTYPSTLRVSQKLFVNAWTDEDGTAAIPRIDSTGTTIATSGANISAGSAFGFYLSYPNDLNGKAVVAPFASSGINNANNIFTPYNYSNNSITPFPFANRGGSATRTDSAQGFGGFNLFGASSYFNNSPTATLQSAEAARYRTRANTQAQPLDTLAVSLVSLVPGWITSPVQLATVNTTAGRPGGIFLAKTDNSQFVQTSAPIGAPATVLGPTNHPVGTLGVNYVANASYGVKAGAGGVFNHAVMFTSRGNLAYSNIYGGTGGSFATYSTTGMNLQSINATIVNVTGGQTYYLPIEYNRTLSRDRIPR